MGSRKADPWPSPATPRCEGWSSREGREDIDQLDRRTRSRRTSASGPVVLRAGRLDMNGLRRRSRSTLGRLGSARNKCRGWGRLVHNI